MKKKLELDEKEANALADLLMNNNAFSTADGEPLNRALYKLNDPIAQCIEALVERVIKERKTEKYPENYPVGTATVTVPIWVIGACLEALRRISDDCDDGYYAAAFDDANDVLRQTLRNEQTK